MSSIFLFTGENAFALREEKKRWISEFVKKHGEENMVRVAGKHLTFRGLLDEVAVAPFIAERRLVVVEGLPLLTKEEVEGLPERVHLQTVVLFIEPKIDKRLAGGKQLLQTAEVKEFALLSGKAMLEWIHAFVISLGASIDVHATSLLLELLGSDQDMLAEELRKLALFANGRPIDASMVGELTLPTFEGVVWTLTDLLSAGRREEALLYAHRHLERGGDAYGLWAVLLGMLKNVVAVASARSSGQRDIRVIAEDLQVHFFAVRTLLPYASRIDPSALKRFLSDTVDADIALKTGAHRATDEAPQELLALIDRFILTAPR